MKSPNTPMPYLWLCLFCFFQSMLPATTPEKSSSKADLFQLAGNQVIKSNAITDGVYLQLDPGTLNELLRNRKQETELKIPIGNEEFLSIQLEKKRIFTSNFELQYAAGTKKEKAVYTEGLHYQGKVKAWPNSLVAISFFENKVMGVISYNGDDYNLGIYTKAAKTMDDVYVLYPESNLLQSKEFICHTPDDFIDIPADLGAAEEKSLTNNSVKVYFECDYQMYLDNGSSVTNTTDFVSAMFNVVAAVYAIDDICVELSEVFVWTINDPYPSSDSGSALDAFQIQLGGNFNGDVAHLLSTANGGNGGLAYVDVICDNYSGIAYSNIDDSYLGLPNYSWTVGVVAHEMGHNLGSPHTHSCSWPGGAIDNCFCPEGSCGFGPEPAGSGGTVMSYCHLGSGTFGSCSIPTANPGVNLNAGFGPSPATLIFNNIENSNCLTACGSPGGGGGGSALDCASAVELSNGITYFGNTNQGSSNISSYSCSDYDESGNEVVHYFTAPVSGTAMIAFNEDVTGYIDLFVLSSCNPNSCITYYDGGMDVNGTIEVTAGLTYYFIADVYSGGNGGAYDLTVSFPEGACHCNDPDALTCDDFESYSVGMLGTQSVCWTTWSGTLGGPEEGMVSNEQASSGAYALKVEGTSANGGPQDVVFLPGEYSSGHYQLSFKIFVPSGKAAYYNVQHVFAAPYQWASDVFFNANGTGTLNAGLTNAATFNYSQNTWVEVLQDIDLDNDQTTLYIGGNQVHSWPFSYQSQQTTGGLNTLAAVDFFPLDNNYLFYIDDIGLHEVGALAFLTVSPGNQNVGVEPGSTTFAINSNVGWSISDDANWLSLSSSGGQGSGTITVNYQENTTTSTRVATLTLTGASNTQIVTVTQEAFSFPPIVLSYNTTHESCFGQEDGAITMTVSGGSENYTYQWSNGVSTANLQNIAPGAYSCTVTDSNASVQTTGTIVVNPAPQMSAVISSPAELTCENVQVFIDATSSIYSTGVSTTWTTVDGHIVSGENTLVLLVDQPGTYSLRLMYDNNPDCVSTASVFIAQAAAPQGTVSSSPETGQDANGTATVSLTGGSDPYSYLWSTSPAQLGPTATGLSAGFYTVQVWDANNCHLEFSVEVESLTSSVELPGLKQFQISPNPSSGIVNVLLEFDETEQATLQIYDVLGRVLWSKTAADNKWQENMDLSAFPNSMYMVTLSKGSMKLTKRLVLHR